MTWWSGNAPPYGYGGVETSKPHTAKTRQSRNRRGCRELYGHADRRNYFWDSTRFAAFRRYFSRVWPARRARRRLSCDGSRAGFGRAADDAREWPGAVPHAQKHAFAMSAAGPYARVRPAQARRVNAGLPDVHCRPAKGTMPHEAESIRRAAPGRFRRDALGRTAKGSNGERLNIAGRAGPRRPPARLRRKHAGAYRMDNGGHMPRGAHQEGALGRLFRPPPNGSAVRWGFHRIFRRCPAGAVRRVAGYTGWARTARRMSRHRVPAKFRPVSWRGFAAVWAVLGAPPRRRATGTALPPYRRLRTIRTFRALFLYGANRAPLSPRRTTPLNRLPCDR